MMHIHKFENAVRLPDMPYANYGPAAGPLSATGRPEQHDSSSPLSGDRELSQLVIQVQQHPEVRVELVDRVKASVQRGEYFTRRAAEETAAKILGRDAS